jgi:hypothetical protein
VALIIRYVLFFLSLLFINILLVGATLANTISVGGYEEEISSWEVAPIDNDGVLISRNGQVQVGDNLYFYIPKSNCNSLENLFSFYTTSNHPRINMLKNREVFIELNEAELSAEVRFIYPMLMGHSVWLSLGTFDIETFGKYLEPYQKFEVFIIDNEEFVANEYFDIETNYWYLDGLAHALNQGKNLCLASTS